MDCECFKEGRTYNLRSCHYGIPSAICYGMEWLGR